MGYRIGVDIGGSFTDFAVLDEASRSLNCLKVFSRPDAPGEEVLDGMRQLGERFGVSPEAVSYFTHGTTVGVNTVIQRKGFALGLITTRNFEHVLELARLKIPDMYNIRSKRPTPLIPLDRVAGVDERLDASGSIVEPLDLASVKVAHARLRAAGCEGAVVALLHSYRNPAHEHAVKEALATIDAGILRLVLQRCLADHPRIRANHDRGHRRLCAAQGGALPVLAARRPAPGRRVAGAARHQVEWRRHERRARQDELRADDPVGDRVRRDRRGLYR